MTMASRMNESERRNAMRFGSRETREFLAKLPSLNALRPRPEDDLLSPVPSLAVISAFRGGRVAARGTLTKFATGGVRGGWNVQIWQLPTRKLSETRLPVKDAAPLCILGKARSPGIGTRPHQIVGGWAGPDRFYPGEMVGPFGISLNNRPLPKLDPFLEGHSRGQSLHAGTFPVDGRRTVLGSDLAA